MVEGNSLENCQARKGLVGSNPTLSAMNYIKSSEELFLFQSSGPAADSLHKKLALLTFGVSHLLADTRNPLVFLNIEHR